MSVGWKECGDYVCIEEVKGTFSEQLGLGWVGGRIGYDVGGGVLNETGEVRLFPGGAVTDGGVPGSCDCGSGGSIGWHGISTPVGGSFYSDVVGGESGAEGSYSRCVETSVGYGWDGGSSGGRSLLSIPSGFNSVGLSGGAISSVELNRGDIVNGVPCGTIFQDAYQGLVSGDGSSGVPLMLPSSVPVSKHCGSGYEEEYISSFVHRHLGVIDGVCRCRLGIVGSMFEVGGVYFLWNMYGVITDGSAKSSMVLSSYGWLESRTNRFPRVFGCRSDYSAYHLMMYGICAGGSVCSSSGMRSDLIAFGDIGIFGVTYARYGVFLGSSQGIRGGHGDMSVFPGSLFLSVMSDTFRTKGAFYLSSRTRFVSWYGTSGLSQNYSNYCNVAVSVNSNQDGTFCNANRIGLDGSYAYDVLVETIALFFRYSVYRENVSALSETLQTFSSSLRYPTQHVFGSGCSEREVTSEIRLSDGLLFGLNTKIIGHTFYRGSIPSGILGIADEYDPTSGFPIRCSSCYYVGEIVPSGSSCCSGDNSESVCIGTSDGECSGYPVPYRHGGTARPETVLGSSNCTNYVDTLDFLYSGAVSPPTMCPGYFAQPVRASPFVDVSRIGEFFGQESPGSFNPVTTNFYSVNLGDAFDVTKDYLFGGSVYRSVPIDYVAKSRSMYRLLADVDGQYPTLTLTYERFSSDLTHADIAPIAADWENDLSNGACLNGGCFDAPTNGTIERLNALYGNQTLFKDTGWFTGGVSLLGGLVNLYNGIRPNRGFYDRYLYGFSGSSGRVSIGTSGGCTYSGDVSFSVDGYDVNTSGCVYHNVSTPCWELSSGIWYVSRDGDCYTCGAGVVFEIGAGTVGTVSTAFNETISGLSASECSSTCVGRSVWSGLPKGYLECTCWTYESEICYMFFWGPLSGGGGSSTGGVVYEMPTIGTMVRGYRYAAGMGMCSGLGDPCFIGTSFDFGVVYGVVGPIPRSGEGSLYVPVNMSTGEPVDRLLNIYGLVSRFFVRGGSSYFTGGVSGSWSASDMNAISSGTSACLRSDYCIHCRGYQSSYLVPGWLWSHWCGEGDITYFSSGLVGVTGALEQSLSVLQNLEPVRLSYGTSRGLNVYFDLGSPPARAFSGTGLTHCWKSTRGVVGDYGESLGGTCVSTDGYCFWQTRRVLYGTRVIQDSALGCGAPSTTGMYEVSVLDGTISWDVGGISSEPSIARCFSNDIDRVCMFGGSVSGEYPIGPLSTHTYGTTSTSVPDAPVTSYAAVIYKLCGCSLSTGTYGTNVSAICYRNGDCGNCTGVPPEYRCGSAERATTSSGLEPGFFGRNGTLDASVSRLCFGCPSGSVGQCGQTTGVRLSSCTSFDYVSGDCPATYAFCGTFYDAYVPGLPAVVALRSVPLSTTLLSSLSIGDVLYNVGSPDGLPGDVLSWIPVVNDGGVPMYDSVNCAPVTTSGSVPSGWVPGPVNGDAVLSAPGSTFDSYGYARLILEQPSYLEPSSNSVPGLYDGPSGLTVSEISTWCSVATTVGDCSSRGHNGQLAMRSRMCLWSNNVCRIRSILQADYVQ
jgi:hypothetical protein